VASHSNQELENVTMQIAGILQFHLIKEL
jgi:hypothetical protein